MKLPNPEEEKLREIFRPYVNAELIFKGIPLYETSLTKEAQEAFEKWKVLKKKELEEEAKIGIVF